QCRRELEDRAIRFPRRGRDTDRLSLDRRQRESRRARGTRPRAALAPAGAERRAARWHAADADRERLHGVLGYGPCQLGGDVLAAGLSAGVAPAAPLDDHDRVAAVEG